MNEPGFAVGVDVGGTKVSAALVAGDGRIVQDRLAQTPAHDLEGALDVIVALVRELRTHEEPVGVGVAGLVDDAGTMRSGANVAWVDAPIGPRLAELVGSPVVVDNDCTVGAYGEWVAGAARGIDDVLYVGVGTGIGGGLILGGRLYRGAHGFAGEIGHVIVEPGGERCGCGNQGCWETVASGSAITRDGARAVTRHAHSLLVELSAGDSSAITGTMVTDAAAKGDPVARGILVEAGTRLGEGIGGLVNVLDPGIVVVGGGVVAGAGDQLLEPARARFAVTLEGDERTAPPIVPAALGDDSAVVGAALLALQRRRS